MNGRVSGQSRHGGLPTQGFPDLLGNHTLDRWWSARVEDPPSTVPSVVVLTGTLQRQAWQDKALPPVEQVGAGLWSIPVPIPDDPLR